MTRKATTNALTDAERKAITPFIQEHVRNGKPLNVEAIMEKPLMLRRLTKEQLRICIKSEVRMERVNYAHATAKTKRMKEEQRTRMEVQKTAIEAAQKVEEERLARIEAETTLEEQKKAHMDQARRMKRQVLKARDQENSERGTLIQAQNRLEEQRQAYLSLQALNDRLQKDLAESKSHVLHLELELQKSISLSIKAEDELKKLTREFVTDKKKMDKTTAELNLSLKAKDKELEAARIAVEAARIAETKNHDELRKLKLINQSYGCGPALEAKIKAAWRSLYGSDITSMETARKKILDEWKLLVEHDPDIDEMGRRINLTKPGYFMHDWLEVRNTLAHQTKGETMSAQDHESYQRLTRQLMQLVEDVEAYRYQKIHLLRFLKVN